MISRDTSSLYDKNITPHKPGVYALYGAHRTSSYIAYVGMGANISKRIYSHLVRGDSNVTVTGAVTIDPEVIASASWWLDDEFTDRTSREAVELIADTLLRPNMRTRRGWSEAAHRKTKDPRFKARMKKLFTGKPSGYCEFPNVSDLQKRITKLEKQIAALEKGG